MNFIQTSFAGRVFENTLLSSFVFQLISPRAWLFKNEQKLSLKWTITKWGGWTNFLLEAFFIQPKIFLRLIWDLWVRIATLTPIEISVDAHEQKPNKATLCVFLSASFVSKQTKKKPHFFSEWEGTHEMGAAQERKFFLSKWFISSCKLVVRSLAAPGSKPNTHNNFQSSWSFEVHQVCFETKPKTQLL